MTHFAQINEQNIVAAVIVAEQEFVDGQPGTWVQTSYNTRGGIHYGQDGEPDSGVALRFNYAGTGHTYDAARDAFIAPQPYPSWVLDEATCQWAAPTVYPDDGKIYVWDEDSTAWVEVEE